MTVSSIWVYDLLTAIGFTFWFFHLCMDVVLCSQDLTFVVEKLMDAPVPQLQNFFFSWDIQKVGT